MTQRARFLIFASLNCALLAPRPAGSHEFALDSTMTAFVKIDDRQADLVIRVPLHLVRPAKFPLKDREIDLANAGPAVQRAMAEISRRITLRDGNRALVPSASMGRLSLPSDRSFDRYADAARHVETPPDPGIPIFSDQGFLDARFTYPIASPDSQFSIETTLAPELKDYLKLAIRYLPADGKSRAMIITSRSGIVFLNPTWYRAAAGFVALGVAHILSGLDHLLFLLCLIIPFRRLRQVLPIVTAFTVAHSFTLLGSAYNLAPEGAWFPPFVETAIAASIVFMALENIVGADLRRRWLITGLFGLIHGFGFSYGLKQNLQFAGNHLLVSLFSFNLGIELGQVVVLAVMLPVLALLFRVVRAERLGVIVFSALVAHTGWHWMIERGEVLWKVPWPRLDAAALATLAAWVMGALLAALLFRFLAKRAGTVFSRRAERRRAS